MSSETPLPLNGLPEFLRVSVLKGLVDEKTARRIELYRRSRGLGCYEEFQVVITAEPDRTMTFETFLPCKGNHLALELAAFVASKDLPKPRFNSLCICGEVG
ncbi:MAG: hypothetical protein V2B18_11435, partial [Pseudomonadota bacterium]